MVLHDMARAKPKSHSFTVPLEPMRMFWGFMSLRAMNGGAWAMCEGQVHTSFVARHLVVSPYHRTCALSTSLRQV